MATKNTQRTQRSPLQPVTAGARAGIATNQAINNALHAVGMALVNAKEFVQTVFTGRLPT